MKGLIFDLDDTLFPEQQYVLSGFRAVGGRIEETFGNGGFYEVARRLFSLGRRGRIFDEALVALGIHPDRALIESLVDLYRDHHPEIHLHQDAARALTYYKDRLRTGIITDGFLIAQRRKVAALSLERHVDHIVYSDEFGRGHWKPSAVPYLRMMELTGCEGQASTYVSDNPLKDFVTAKALGWTTVRIRRIGGEYSEIIADSTHSAHFEIATLDDLASILDS